MAGLYILICLIIIVINYANIIKAFEAIFVNAFSVKSILGGFLGMGVKKLLDMELQEDYFQMKLVWGQLHMLMLLQKLKIQLSKEMLH